MRPLELVIDIPVASVDEEDQPCLNVVESPKIWVAPPAALKEEDEVEVDDGFFDTKTPTAAGSSLFSSTNPSQNRRRTIDESSLNPEAMKMRLQAGQSRSALGMKRNVSTPGFGRLARLDCEKESAQASRRLSSIVYAVPAQDGTTQYLKPHSSRRSSRAIVRPLSRKDIFYSGSIYNLALDMSEETTEQQLIGEAAMRGYRQSIISIPKGSTYPHRGSVVASHLSIPAKEIGDPQMVKEKIESSNPVMSVLKEMLDFEIMLNPLFVLVCISNIFGTKNITFLLSFMSPFLKKRRHRVKESAVACSDFS